MRPPASNVYQVSPELPDERGHHTPSANSQRAIATARRNVYAWDSKKCRACVRKPQQPSNLVVEPTMDYRVYASGGRSQ